MHCLEVTVKKNNEAEESAGMTYERVKELADGINYEEGKDCLYETYLDHPFIEIDRE